MAEPAQRHFRTMFLSDVHLGTRGCQAHLLLDFLRYHDAETVYLVGDIVDGWRLRRNWYWPQEHNDVVQKLLRKGRRGARIIYVPGNHDEFLRDYIGTHFGGVEVHEEFIHESATGEKLLVIHGDRFDIVVRHAKWLAHFGDWAYISALNINTGLNVIRRKLGFSYWSLSAWAKMKVKNAVNFMGAFQDALANEAQRRGLDGVICGHIHHAKFDDDQAFKYINVGDWVESCTAVVEDQNGSFEIIKWSTLGRQRPLLEAAAEETEPEKAGDRAAA